MQEHPYEESHEREGVKVITCTSCGFRHQWPIPSDEEVREIYRKHFGGTVKGGFAERKKEDEVYWNRAFDRRLRTYRELLDDVDSPRILDVGCGTGNLLRFFRSNGWQVHGIEPNEQFNKILAEEDIPCLAKLTDDMSAEDWRSLGAFEVVNLSMFLEHIRDPIGLVQDVVDHALAPGGVLTVESPNDFNPLQETIVQAHGEERWWVHPLHVNYFDFDSIEALARRAGLDPLVRDAQFPLELFQLMGDRYVGDPETGRAVHKKRVELERVMHESGKAGLLQEIYQTFASKGLGRTAIVHSRKEERD